MRKLIAQFVKRFIFALFENPHVPPGLSFMRNAELPISPFGILINTAQRPEAHSKHKTNLWPNKILIKLKKKITHANYKCKLSIQSSEIYDILFCLRMQFTFFFFPFVVNLCTQHRIRIFRCRKGDTGGNHKLPPRGKICVHCSHFASIPLLRTRDLYRRTNTRPQSGRYSVPLTSEIHRTVSSNGQDKPFFRESSVKMWHKCHDRQHKERLHCALYFYS